MVSIIIENCINAQYIWAILTSNIMFLKHGLSDALYNTNLCFYMQHNYQREVSKIMISTIIKVNTYLYTVHVYKYIFLHD